MGLIDFESAARRVVERSVPADGEVRAEIVATACDATAGAGLPKQLRELSGLAGLGLRLRSRAATDDDPRQLVAQGADLGATLVLVLVAAWAWLAAPEVPIGAATATTFALAAVVAARPAASGALALGAAAVAAAASWLSMPIVAGALVSVGLLAIGRGGRRRMIRPERVAGTLLALTVAAVVAEATLSTRPPVELLVVVAATGPLPLLAAGWFDPRLAIAATSVWLWRLAAVDLVDLTSSVAELGHGLTIDGLVIRWLVMGASVVVGSIVSARATRRAVSL